MSNQPPLAPEGVFGARIESFVTPLGLQDVLFSESFDSRLPCNARWCYNDPHPDIKAFPEHVLVWVQAGRSQGQQVRWYASKRVTQDLYNYEFSQADIGGTKFNAVTRSYLHLRDGEFDPLDPTPGFAMPDVPEGKFAAGYVLAERAMKPSGDERLDSLFILERRTFVLRAPLVESVFDPEIGTALVKTTTFWYLGEAGRPAAGLSGDGVLTEVQQISAHWWMVSITSSPDAARDAYFVTLPTTASLPNLPSVLTEVVVEWNTDSGIGSYESENSGFAAGTSYSLGASEQATANSSAGLIPSVRPVIKDYTGDSIPSETSFFYMKMPVSAGDILGRVGASAHWPVFKPKSVSIVCMGAKKSLRATLNASASKHFSDDSNSEEITVGKGEDYDVSLTSNTENIRPTLHASIPLDDFAPPDGPIELTAHTSVEWTGTNFPTVDEDNDIDGVFVTGSVSPSSIPATTPTDIPHGGIYLLPGCKVSFVDSRYVRVAAETLDASIFAD